MASTEERLTTLAKDNLDIKGELNFDTKFGDYHVSSVNAIAFLKLVSKEFNITIPVEDFAELSNLRDLASYIDSHAK